MYQSVGFSLCSWNANKTHQDITGGACPSRNVLTYYNWLAAYFAAQESEQQHQQGTQALLNQPMNLHSEPDLLGLALASASSFIPSSSTFSLSWTGSLSHRKYTVDIGCVYLCCEKIMLSRALRVKLLKHYLNPRKPGALSGVSAFYRGLIDIGIKGVSRKQVQEFLQSIPTYQVHKPRRSKWIHHSIYIWCFLILFS